MNNFSDVLAYRINDASRVSGLGRTKLYQLIGEGRLKVVKIGGRTLIPAVELRRLIMGGPDDA